MFFGRRNITKGEDMADLFAVVKKEFGETRYLPIGVEKLAGKKVKLHSHLCDMSLTEGLISVTVSMEDGDKNIIYRMPACFLRFDSQTKGELMKKVTNPKKQKIRKPYRRFPVFA